MDYNKLTKIADVVSTTQKGHSMLKRIMRIKDSHNFNTGDFALDVANEIDAIYECILFFKKELSAGRRDAATFKKWLWELNDAIEYAVEELNNAGEGACSSEDRQMFDMQIAEMRKDLADLEVSVSAITDATGDKVNIHTDIEGIEVGKDDDSNRIIKTRDEKGNDQVIKVNKQNEVVNDGCCGGKKSPKKKPVKKVSDSSPEVDKFMEAIQIFSNKYNDPSKVSVTKTPKGNWDVKYDGKRLGIINSYMLDEDTASAQGWITDAASKIKKEIENAFAQVGLKFHSRATGDYAYWYTTLLDDNNTLVSNANDSGALSEMFPRKKIISANAEQLAVENKYCDALETFETEGRWPDATSNAKVSDASSSDTRKEHMLEWMKQNKSMLNQFLKDVLHQSIQTETWKNEYRDMTMDDIINGYSAPWSSRRSYEGEARRERSELTRKGTEGKNDMLAKSIINELGIDINHSDVSVGHYNAADGIEYLTIRVEPFIDDNNASIEDINSKVVEKYGEDADARKNKFGDLIISIPSNEVSITDAAEDAPTSRVSGLAKRDRSLDHNWSVDDYKVAYIIAEFGKKGIEAVAKKCGMDGLNSNTAVATYLINTSDAGLQLALTGIRKYVTGDYGADENEFLSSYKMNQNFLTAYNELNGKSLEECVASVNPDNVGDKDANIAGLEKKHAEKNLKANERQKLETERKAALRTKLKHIESTALTHRVKNKLSKPQSEKLAKKDHGWTAEDEADAKKFGLIDSIRKMNDNCQTDRYAEFSISPEAIYGILTEGESSVKIPNNGMNVNDYAKSCIKVMQGIAKDCGNKLPSIQYSIVGDEICFKVK